MNVSTAESLERTLQRIDGRGYKAYQDLRGHYRLGAFELEVAHVQGDPYAPPSRIHVRLGHETSGFGEAVREALPRRRGLEDFLARMLSAAIRGAGTREIGIDRLGQEILPRTLVGLHGDHLEARLSVQLPAAGRRILGRQAAKILLQVLPAVLARSLERRAVDERALRRHQDVIEDHTALVALLEEREWVAFVAAGAVLPRRAGHDDHPLESPGRAPVIAFEPPPTLTAEVDLPHAGRIRGMAIPRGVTLLVGGGFHGKSTLLEAISRGIYPHIPGDGREQVATDPRAVKVRAEDGRAVTRTDISPFIGDLPYGRSTRDFSTTNASGSTSQAANIVEALEAGARLLLLDEDTSATNFMIRDAPMRRLLRPGQEPITPFLDRVRNLFRDRGVSTILVVGGSGEYFRVADRVIQMDRYLPRDVTAEAREIAPPGGGSSEAFPPAGCLRRLRLDAYRRQVGPKGPRIKAPGTHRLLVEREEVDLGACEQLVSPSQTRALAEILGRLLEGDRAAAPWNRLGAAFTPEELEELLGGLGDGGLDRFSRFPRGDLAAVRTIEVLAMINRLRSLGVDR
ncbi:MAG: ABC-ATPase domain-containing protein [Candidatus Eisenbacteria sp.]|nr:ABC-ATPase domain-containing protein [Candidatus Eisenbacteria bacterium]